MRAASSFLIWKHRLKFKRFKCSLSRLQSWRVRRSERRAGEAPGQAQFATRSLLVWTSVNKGEAVYSGYVGRNLDDLPKCAATRR